MMGGLVLETDLALLPGCEAFLGSMKNNQDFKNSRLLAAVG